MARSWTVLGKTVRLERILNRKSRKTVIIPMDHGTTVGPIRGLTDMPQTVQAIWIQTVLV